MKKIALVGVTGSIGKQVMEVVKRHPDKYKIVAMCSFSSSAEFDRAVKQFKPEYSAVASTDIEAALKVAEYGDADIVFNAASGFAGMEYSIRAIRAGKTLALANKETLVCGGEMVTHLAEINNVEIIPVDSEHSAIWQCLGFKRKAPIRRLILTASGGAFRGRKWADLKDVTPAQALKHPTWKMGNKITVDSATLINKGYEVIEAHTLFGVPYTRIETVLQPQSLVHSMVEYRDGAILAQIGNPSMEVPIQLALSYPQRMLTSVEPMGFKQAFSIDFEPLNRKEYPLYDLALTCGKEGGTLPCALNAADEIAVKAFLDGKIAFTDIYTAVARVLSTTVRDEVVSFQQLEEVDRTARWKAQKIIYRLQ